MNSQRNAPKTKSARSPRRGKSSTGRQSPQAAGGNVGARKAFRYLSLLLVTLLGTGLVIAGIVALTPLDPLPSAVETTGVKQPQVAGNAWPAAQAAVVDSSQAAASTPAPSAERAPLAFPEQAEAIDVAKLQQELRDLANTLTSEFSTDPNAYHFAAKIYFELKQTKLAEESWRKCVEQGTNSAGPYAGLAEILAGSGRDQEVIELLAPAHAAGITSGETLRWLAEAQENLGLLTDALTTLEEALTLDHLDANAWLARARVLNQMQQYASAEESVLKNLELAGDSQSALVVLSTAQTRQQKTEQAQETRKRLAGLRPLPNRAVDDFQGTYETALRNIAVDAYVSSAALASENHRPLTAEKYIWRAIKLDPNQSQAYMSLAGLLREQGRLEEVFRVQQQLVKIQPENPLNYVNLASVAAQVGQVPLAKEILLRAVDMDLQGVVVHNSLVHLYLALGDFAQAKRFANQIVTKYPSVESYLLLASVLEASGEMSAAASALEQAKLLAPDHQVWTTP